MILFTLRCASGHEFEAWFRDGEGFETQQSAGEIACPHCGDSQIEKAVMAPNIGRSREKAPPISPAQMRAALTEFRRQVELRLCRRALCRGGAPHSLRRGRPTCDLWRGERRRIARARR